MRRRTPQGVRGLKYHLAGHRADHRTRRTPQGVRGLKFALVFCPHLPEFVAPRKGCVD